MRPPIQQSIAIVHRPLKIGLIGPSDARVLDLTGPWEVFSRVNEVLAEQKPDDNPGYQLELATTSATRFIDCFGGLKIQARNFRSLDPCLDTVLIGGGRAVWELPRNEKLLEWLRLATARARRVAAIGSGAFFLGRSRSIARPARDNALALGRTSPAQLSEYLGGFAACVCPGRQVFYLGRGLGIN